MLLWADACDGRGRHRAARRRARELPRARHVRRRFYELAQDGASPVSSGALARIARLYAIEEAVRGHPPQARHAARDRQSRPIVAELRAVLDASAAQASRKSALAEAIRYATTRWDGLTRFLDNGRIEIDSNTVERAIRPIALGRKNALFAGSDEGGDHWAVIASLIENCKLNAVDPQAWLAQTLERLAAGHTVNRLNELMPWRVTPAVG